jgi:hypothetical protein
VRSRQRRREPEPDNLAADDGRRIHGISVRERSPSHKPLTTKITIAVLR